MPCASQPRGSGLSSSLQHHSLIRPATGSPPRVRCKQGQPQNPAHVALRDLLGLGDLGDLGVDAAVQQLCHRHARGQHFDQTTSPHGCTILPLTPTKLVGVSAKDSTASPPAMASGACSPLLREFSTLAYQSDDVALL